MGNFIYSGENAVGDVKRMLEPFQIHNVTFVGAEFNEIQGKADPNMKYKAIVFKFENENGFYNETIFEPKENDFARRENEYNGNKFMNPSNWEVSNTIINNILGTLNPEGAETLAKKSKDIKSFDMLAKAVCKLLEGAKGKETQIKLMGRTNKNGRVIPMAPNVCGINKSGEFYVNKAQVLIGQNLFFTDKEEKTRQKFLNVQPTQMNDNGENNTGISSFFDEEKPNVGLQNDKDVQDLLGDDALNNLF